MFSENATDEDAFRGCYSMRVIRLFFWLVVLGAGAFLPVHSFAEVKDMEILRQTDALDVRVRYPALGVSGIDDDIAQWAQNAVQSFEQDFGHSEEQRDAGVKYLLHIAYRVERPSGRAVSVVFDVETYTGGAHGTLDILVRSYDTQTSLALTLPYLFEDVEIALNLMSTYSYEALAEKLGEDRAEDMLRLGTTPDADNFSALALRPGGVRIYFQPYQVAPWAAGPQFVDMPLEALSDARPQLEWWGRIGEAAAPAATPSAP